jgi:hypothetical protein
VSARFLVAADEWDRGQSGSATKNLGLDELEVSLSLGRHLEGTSQERVVEEGEWDPERLSQVVTASPIAVAT